MIQLIESQRPETLKAFIEKSLKRMAMKGSRDQKSILNDPLFIEARKALRNCMASEDLKVKELVKVSPSKLSIISLKRICSLRFATSQDEEVPTFQAISVSHLTLDHSLFLPLVYDKSRSFNELDQSAEYLFFFIMKHYDSSSSRL
jgi:hypothetical protein